jgi:leucyl-tRNA synthetase
MIPTKQLENHKTIKKVADDIENFSFNTSVSQFMICVNELTHAIPLLADPAPYAPHIAEELWSLLVKALLQPCFRTQTFNRKQLSFF